MSTYEYTIIDLQNSIQRGVVKGWSKKQASKQLAQNGSSVVTLARVQRQISLWHGIFRYVSRMDRIVFLRSLLTMMKAGLNLPEALASTREQNANPNMKRIIADAEKSVLAGQTLSSALARHPNVFSFVTVAMIRVGEHGGKLIETLEFLVKQQEGDFRLLRKIRNALVYPALILVTMIAIVAIMMIVVIPKIDAIYQELSADLPFFTAAMINTSNFIVNYGIYLAVIILALLILHSTGLKKLPKYKKAIHKLILGTPLIGPVAKKLNLAMFSRSLYMLTKAGVSIDESLLLSSDAVSNVNYRNAIKSGQVFVRRGVSLTDIFKGRQDLFLPLFRKMIRTGEESGYLDDMFGHIAKYYDEDIDNWTDNLSTLVEPILLLVTGVVVGGIALAVLFPLWNFANIL